MQCVHGFNVPTSVGLVWANAWNHTRASPTPYQTFNPKAWGKFIAFDNIVAGLIWILPLCKAVKWVIDTLFHGKILYDLYGLSGYLLGAIWDSVTTYFIHRKAKEVLPAHVVCKDHSAWQKKIFEKTSPRLDATPMMPNNDSPPKKYHRYLRYLEEETEQEKN